MLVFLLVLPPTIDVYDVATADDIEDATQGITVAANAGAVTLTPLLGFGTVNPQPWTAAFAPALRATLTEALKRTGHIPLDEDEDPPAGGVSLTKGFKLEINVVGSNNLDGYVEWDEEAQKFVIKAPNATVLHTHLPAIAGGVLQALVNLGVPLPA